MGRNLRRTRSPPVTSRQLAASTLGIFDETLDDVVALLKHHGVTVVELRSAPGALVHAGMPDSSAQGISHALKGAGISVLSLATSVRLMSEATDAEVHSQLTAELQLAHELGASFMRVFPGAATPSREAVGAARLMAVLDLAMSLDVRIVVETHDSHPDGASIAQLLQLLDAASPNHRVGAVWDVLHPWRTGESLAMTAALLAPYVTTGRGYVQVKDVASPTNLFPVLPGTGSVPIAEFIAAIDSIGYDGPVSLEWERHWEPTAPPLSDALTSTVHLLDTIRA